MRRTCIYVLLDRLFQLLPDSQDLHNPLQDVGWTIQAKLACYTIYTFSTLLGIIDSKQPQGTLAGQTRVVVYGEKQMYAVCYMLCLDQLVQHHLSFP